MLKLSSLVASNLTPPGVRKVTQTSNGETIFYDHFSRIHQTTVLTYVFPLGHMHAYSHTKIFVVLCACACKYVKTLVCRINQPKCGVPESFLYSCRLLLILF